MDTLNRSQPTFPISYELFTLIAQEKYIKVPSQIIKNSLISHTDKSHQSKMFSLPYIPERLYQEIKDILSPANNLGEKLEFIFQIELNQINQSFLPNTGILQFYCSSNELISSDNKEKDTTFNNQQSGAYQFIYIPQVDIESEKCVDEHDTTSIIKVTDRFNHPYSISIKEHEFDLPILSIDYLHILKKHKHESTTKETISKFIKTNSSQYIHEAILNMTDNHPDKIEKVFDYLYHPQTFHGYVSKIGGYGKTFNIEPRDIETTKYGTLLIQIYESFNNGHNIDTEKITTLHVNTDDINSWKEHPTVNMKKKIKSLLYVEYRNNKIKDE